MREISADGKSQRNRKAERDVREMEWTVRCDTGKHGAQEISERWRERKMGFGKGRVRKMRCRGQTNGVKGGARVQS